MKGVKRITSFVLFLFLSIYACERNVGVSEVGNAHPLTSILSPSTGERKRDVEWLDESGSYWSS